MTVPARVSLVTLGVADLSRSTAFYEALGWRRSSASADEVSFFHTAGPVLALYPAHLLAADADLPADPVPRFRGVALAINLESRELVDDVLRQAQAAGATLLKAAQPAEWGGYSGYFADPDGHAWEVAHNPHWPIADDGTVTLPD
jgi:predicted lactoylglutathione lyase